MSIRKWIGLFLIGFAAWPSNAKDTALLNVSYDVTREFYKDFNAAFIESWKAKTDQTVTINQSHGGSSKQARSVIDGLAADVVTMNQETDIDAIANAGLLPKTWRKRLPHNSAPYTSTIIFLVRKGNPKQIKDWTDLVKPGVSVVIPNPKTSGNGRYSYLAAWGYALQKNNNDPAKAKEFAAALFNNVPVLDTGGRGATTTFAQRGILTFEAEVYSIIKELGANQFESIVPSASILAEAPISLVDRVVIRNGTKEIAQAYLDFHFTPEGQEIAAKHFYRPRLDSIAQKHAAQFKPLKLFKIEEVAGGWAEAQKKHFADGGQFDEIYSKK
jgi:sulfate transport system substrate-binding protein